MHSHESLLVSHRIIIAIRTRNIYFWWNRSCMASDSAYCDRFLRDVVCLSVCHIHAPCLNCSTDINAILQTHSDGGPGSRDPPVLPQPNLNVKLHFAYLTDRARYEEMCRNEWNHLRCICCHLANSNERFRLLPHYFCACFE